jgi:8-oxo-dGTP pyrophosphatase MutT (NUDIX family)
MEYFLSLPRLPKHIVSVSEIKDQGTGFLKVKSGKCEIAYDDGHYKEMFVDFIYRKSYDAVGIVAFSIREGRCYVHLVSCIRPALYKEKLKETEREPEGNPILQWEIPAGLVEEFEKGRDGVLSSSVRELEEEVGYKTHISNHSFLGFEYFSSTGIMGERIYLTKVNVTDSELIKPQGDGSPLEMGSKAVAVEIGALKESIRIGKISDSKTIMGVFMLYEYINEPSVKERLGIS